MSAMTDITDEDRAAAAQLIRDKPEVSHPLIILHGGADDHAAYKPAAIERGEFRTARAAIEDKTP